jgi:hypothetical protein
MSFAPGLEALDVLEASDQADDEEWLARARHSFQKGRAAVARGEAFRGSSKEIMSRARTRLAREAKPA